MDQNAVEVMCQVAQALATLKGIARSLDDRSYRIAREQIGNCLEDMAKYCDTSPFKLMSGQVEEIMGNYSATRN